MIQKLEGNAERFSTGQIMYYTVSSEEFDRVNKLLDLFERYVTAVCKEEGQYWAQTLGEFYGGFSEEESEILRTITEYKERGD